MRTSCCFDKRDFCPMVSPDGKYLFFSSKRIGEGDIYWADVRVIDTLKQSLNDWKK